MPGRRRGGNGPRGQEPSRVPDQWFAGWLDAELADLFRDQPELAETARLLHSSRPEPQADPAFRSRLRRLLVADAARAHGASRWWQLGPAHFAWGGAGLGAALIGATVLTLLAGHVRDHQIVIGSSLVAAQHSVSPADAITVAFNQPMDQQAVQAGVHIEPATQVMYAWQGNNLVITPVHHLSGNTPYTVTIDQPSLRAASGATANAPLQISFGTAATPPPGPSTATPPALVPVALGQTAPGARLLFAPDGSVVATAGWPEEVNGTSPTPGTSTSQSSPAATSSPTGSAPPSGSASASAQGQPQPPSLLDFPAGGATPVVLGQSATAAAFAPDGGTLATALSNSQGGSTIEVSPSVGGAAAKLASSTNPVTTLTWASDDRLIYVDGLKVISIALSGATHTLATLAAGTGAVSLAPGGGYAYIAPVAGIGGNLQQIASGSSRVLSGSGAGVAFSGDGKTVAWVDESGSQPRLLFEPVDRDAPAAVSVLDPNAPLGTLTLNRDGSTAAYVLTPAVGAARTVIARLPSGTPIAVGPAAVAAAFSPSGDAIAVVVIASQGALAELAPIPGASPTGGPQALPAAANTALEAFVDAQVERQQQVLTTLAPGLDAFAETPKGLTRAYTISAVAQPDGTVLASVELIVDPTAAHASARVAEETLALGRTADREAYIVTGINLSGLHDEAAGPHVVHVTSTTVAGTTTVQISFDSDLQPSTVAGAILALGPAGTAIPPVVSYDANSRTATITLAGAGNGVITLTVDITLRDFDGQSLAGVFTTHVTTGSAQ